MAGLSDLKKKIHNTTSRQSNALIRTESLSSTSYAIQSVDTTNNIIVVNGDLTADTEFEAGDRIYVDGSTGNDGVYTISSTAYDSTNDETDITLNQNLPDSTADGNVHPDKDFSFVNAGRVTGTNVTLDENASDPDQDGRESSNIHPITVTFSMQQTAAKEMSIIPDFVRPAPDTEALYPNGHTIYFTGTNDIGASDADSNLVTTGDDVREGTVDFGSISDPQGLQFLNVIFKVSGDFDLTGGDSVITLEFTAQILPNELDDFETDPTILVSPT